MGDDVADDGVEAGVIGERATNHQHTTSNIGGGAEVARGEGKHWPCACGQQAVFTLDNVVTALAHGVANSHRVEQEGEGLLPTVHADRRTDAQGRGVAGQHTFTAGLNVGLGGHLNPQHGQAVEGHLPQHFLVISGEATFAQAV